jgi:hypothetical protein
MIQKEFIAKSVKREKIVIYLSLKNAIFSYNRVKKIIGDKFQFENRKTWK